MTEPAIFLPTNIERGQVWQLGRHRLMCGDATSKEDVAKLFAGERPTLVITSPPYAKQRNYDRPIACWESLMFGAFSNHSFADDAQLLIVLGPIRIKGELVYYWEKWISLMRAKQWFFCGQYIWDKKLPQAGQNHGFCYSNHEYIFHLRKKKVLLNKIVANKHAGLHFHGSNYADVDNTRRRIRPGIIQSHRAPGSVFSCFPEKNNRTGHPAVFPVTLPAQMIAAWQKPGCIIYDPFCGAGTTLLAAEQEGVVGLGMEISPDYCLMAIKRWNQQPDVTFAHLVATQSSHFS